MANTIVVTLSELIAASNKIEQAVANYETTSKNLKTAADNLSNTWEGDSHNAFVEQQEKAYTWYMEMVRIVRTYSEALKKAKDNYGTADEEAASEIKKR